jgi:hypothetical protein
MVRPVVRVPTFPSIEAVVPGGMPSLKSIFNVPVDVAEGILE